MKLLIARHGKALKQLNAAGYPQILGGSYVYDAGLTEEGFKQAVQLAESLKQHRIDAAYASFLLRARQTAETTMSAYGWQNSRACFHVKEGRRICIDERLNERHFGMLSGMHCDEILFRPDVMQYLDHPALSNHLGITPDDFEQQLRCRLYSTKPDIEATTIITINSELPKQNLETVEEIRARLTAFEDGLRIRHDPSSTIAVFCHGDVMRCWMMKIISEPSQYEPCTVEAVKAMPSFGNYRRIPDCGLLEVRMA